MGTFLVAVLVFGGVILICRSLWRQHKAAKASGAAMCGGGCGGCSGCAYKDDRR